ncbi:MAG: flagellar biosynthetic protein FliO [Selenomonadaceae bacterium]|nr:flagellar biosynthetic protein FliO [Selenomonadaceae bacterium]
MIVSAAPESGGYLSGYDSTPQVQGISFWSTAAYLFTLLLVFIFVLVLAYLAARFLSGKFSPTLNSHGGKILEHLALAPNRSICVVEMAGRVFLLGVTEHSINTLSEITDKDEIERLRADSVRNPISKETLSNELDSLVSFVRNLRNRR